MKRVITIISAVIIALSLLATCTGIFTYGSEQPGEITTIHGEKFSLHGTGLYRYDTTSYAAQAVAQDWVTLVVGIPLLFAAIILYRKGAIRGHLLLAGALGYILYTYTSLTFLSAYNEYFLIYVALFSASLFAFILTLKELDIQKVYHQCVDSFPRRSTIIFLAVLALFLLMAWLGRIIPGLVNQTPPVGLEAYTTLVIQALDLGVVVPACFLVVYLLAQKEPWGYALAQVVLIKGLLMGIALLAMVIHMIVKNVPVNPVESAIFGLIPVVCAWITIRAINSVKAG